MSSTTSIFNFDHGQKKMHKAIGVEESYIDDLDHQIAGAIKNYLFDEDGNTNADLCPSKLVEAALHEFSYSQLVILAGRHLQDKLDLFEKKLEMISKMGADQMIKKIALDGDDIPEEIREFLIKLADQGKGDTERTAIKGEDLPQEVKDFLDKIVRKQIEDEDNDD
jgi:hypothetical protein